jgi:hypothetical protein
MMPNTQGVDQVTNYPNGKTSDDVLLLAMLIWSIT